MNYTKGEWKVGTKISGHCGLLIISKGKALANVYLNSLARPMTDEHNLRLPENKETQSNANLISAAPDMYEALKLAYDAIPEGRNVKTVIENALAKAEGK